MDEQQLEGRLAFLKAAEALKDTLRSGHTSGGRPESTAEHSWRLCLLALAFEDQLSGVDMLKLLKLCIVHDLGEAIHGDVPAVAQVDKQAKQVQERQDMLQLTAPLDAALRAHVLSLWEEYEEGLSRKRGWPRPWTSWKPCCSTTRAGTRPASITLSTWTMAGITPRPIPSPRPSAQCSTARPVRGWTAGGEASPWSSVPAYFFGAGSGFFSVE